MKEKFWCASCKKIFEAIGEKKEWINPIYGPCLKYVASCPVCKEECDEYRDPNAQKKSSGSSEMSCAGNCSSCQFNH